MEFLTKDVDMRQIPVKGRRAVLVQVEIIFNDGGAESAKLVPSATAPKAVTPK